MIIKFIKNVRAVSCEKHLTIVWWLPLRQLTENLHDFSNQLRMYTIFGFFKSNHTGQTLDIKQRCDSKQPKNTVTHLPAIKGHISTILFMNTDGLRTPISTSLYADRRHGWKELLNPVNVSNTLAGISHINLLGWFPVPFPDENQLIPFRWVCQEPSNPPQQGADGHRLPQKADPRPSVPFVRGSTR